MNNEKRSSSDRDFGDIELYRQAMIGRTVVSVDFGSGDEGLIVLFDDGTTLDFGFSTCEGTIGISKG